MKNDLERVRAKCLGIVPTNEKVSKESLTVNKKDKVKDKVQKGDKVKKGDKGKNVNLEEELGDKYKCKWSVYVSKTVNDKWKVKSFEPEHICLQSR